MSMVGKCLNLFAGYFHINKKELLEYRVSNFTALCSSLLNSAIWLVFWWVFFRKFPNISEWQFEHLFTIWAGLNASLGLVSIAYNVYEIPLIINEGKLEYYLIRPKNALFHLLIARMQLVDLIESIIWFINFIILKQQLRLILLFVLMTVLSALIIHGFLLILGSLGFFFKSADGVGTELYNALITFSTYPNWIFRGIAQWIIFTVIPAGFISYVPIQVIYNHIYWWILGSAGVGLLLNAMGYIIFSRGLKNFETSNTFVLRAD
ncbi:ABC-2 family transporter protein [Thermoanaerobacterium sp. RBIITD]|uniref:ABC transporter permease n=1 Tax=Thermoanaerobacterium sp. RBIITD TaxID=1550240 RepID=UPI000BB6CD13|nr:ABC-2 family transporter protein [Thermoanaerobacterium sp. RBIITD]SNX54505.1 ABC-2 type transport system permease protein [Thermoanaerobacterium sp. RBIITD]